MNKARREALEKAGWSIGSAEDFLGLTEEERRMVDQGLERDRRLAELRARASQAVRDARVELDLTQAQLAESLGTKQPAVSKIEAAAEDVSLDQMFRSFFTLGGTATVVFTPAQKPGKPTKKKAPAG